MKYQILFSEKKKKIKMSFTEILYQPALWYSMISLSTHMHSTVFKYTTTSL